MTVNSTVVIILQYISISNEHVVNLKQYYKSIVSQKAGEKNKSSLYFLNGATAPPRGFSPLVTCWSDPCSELKVNCCFPSKA